MSHLGLIIGRFQPFHRGHKLLVNASLNENEETLILIGSSNKRDEKNPYTFELRKKIIEGEISSKNIHIGELPDFPDDIQWVECILGYIPKNIKKVTLYCGDIQYDSAVQSLLSLKDTLPFPLSIKEIPRSIIPISATQIRNWIQQNDTKQLQKYVGETTIELTKRSL